jgi:hypothetical protein
MKRTGFLFLLIIIFVSCNRTTEKNSAAKTKRNVSIREVIDYEMKDILVKDTSCKKDVVKCAHVRVEYPEFYGNNSAIPNRLTHDLITYLMYDNDLGTSRSGDLKLVAKDFITDYGNFKKSFPTSNLVWYFKLKSYPLYEHDSILCFAFESDLYRGGAHDLTGKYFITVNRYSGKKIVPLTLVSNRDAFKEASEKIFRLKKGIKPDEDLNGAGFNFSGGKFKLPSNIGVCDSGFVLRYNVYEIAPFSEGPTEFVVPFSKAGISK